MPKQERHKYRTVWISDIHLGSTQCQADKLLEFLKKLETERLYLVGDIIDLWALSRKSYWPADHNTVLQKVLKMARPRPDTGKPGTEVIYIPGNHDEPFREHDNMEFGNIRVAEREIHITADGRKLMVIHGDEFDTITRYHRWIAKLGSIGYDTLIDINRCIRAVSKFFGYNTHFSISQYIKHRVKNAVQFITDYEESIVDALKNEGLNGVVCGHIHHPEFKLMEGGFEYWNDGDFVESLTAIVEHHDGSMEIIKWDHTPL